MTHTYNMNHSMTHSLTSSKDIFRFPDVYLTGILRIKSNIENPIEIKGIFSERKTKT